MYFKTNKIPLFYLEGERYYSIIHSRLRNNCSNLNRDLFINHLRDDDLCECGQGKEDAEHFFFKCNVYNVARLKLFLDTRQFHPLSCQSLLFGSKRLNDTDNNTLMTSVRTYIRDTNRFKRANN